MATTEGMASGACGQEEAGAEGGASFVLWPHRSLPRSGLALLLALVALGAVVPVLQLGLMRAPAGPMLMIAVPCLAMPAALALAFWANNRAALLRQTIRIADGCLEVRTARRGAPDRVSAFNPYWVRVEVVTDPSGDNRVILAEGRRRLAVGTFLSAEEREALATALRDSLCAYRDGVRG